MVIWSKKPRKLPHRSIGLQFIAMSKIITKLIGGLGNQMFQYATGRALAHRLDVPLSLDASGFEHYDLRRYGSASGHLCHGRLREELAKAGVASRPHSLADRAMKFLGVRRPAIAT